MWSRAGRELAYTTLDRRLMMVSYEVNGESFRVGKSRLWSSRQVSGGGRQDVDLAPDGKHCAVLLTPDGSTEPRPAGGVTILLNFFDELRRHAPVGGK